MWTPKLCNSNSNFLSYFDAGMIALENHGEVNRIICSM